MDLPRYCLVGVRPVKLVRTEDGGMTCLEFNPESDRFERSMDVLTRVLFPTEPDVDVVTEQEFEAAVARLRARRRRWRPRRS